MKAPSKERIRIFLIDAAITIVLIIGIRGAAGAIYNAYLKVSWAIQVIHQIEKLGPDFQNLIPPPPNTDGNGKTDLAGWIRQNLPRAGAADYAEVGEIFLATAAKLRAGELDGKREAYAETARELARTVDRATWTPFINALVARVESEHGELADLFEIAGNAIRGQSAGFSAEPAEGGRIG